MNAIENQLIKSNVFKEKLDKAQTKGDAIKLLTSLKISQLRQMENALNVMNEFFGLTMRDQWVLLVITGELARRDEGIYDIPKKEAV